MGLGLGLGLELGLITAARCPSLERNAFDARVRAAFRPRVRVRMRVRLRVSVRVRARVSTEHTHAREQRDRLAVAERARLRHGALPRVQREVHGECAAEDGALGLRRQRLQG